MGTFIYFCLLTVIIFVNIILSNIVTVGVNMKSIEEINQQQKEQLFKLIAWVGSQSRLAKELGTTNQVVYSWTKRGRISATAARLVDEKTKGLFKKEDLRPDVVVWEE